MVTDRRPLSTWAGSASWIPPPAEISTALAPLDN